jgi:hypothetical protein
MDGGENVLIQFGTPQAALPQRIGIPVNTFDRREIGMSGQRKWTTKDKLSNVTYL